MAVSQTMQSSVFNQHVAVLERAAANTGKITDESRAGVQKAYNALTTGRCWGQMFCQGSPLTGAESAKASASMQKQALTARDAIQILRQNGYRLTWGDTFSSSKSLKIITGLSITSAAGYLGVAKTSTIATAAAKVATIAKGLWATAPAMPAMPAMPAFLVPAGNSTVLGTFGGFVAKPLAAVAAMSPLNLAILGTLSAAGLIAAAKHFGGQANSEQAKEKQA